MRKVPSDETDTIAYAVSYLIAAEVIGRNEESWTDNHTLIVPFYALIGFALENCLKSVLEFRKVNPTSKWFHSHDLTGLRKLAEEAGFRMANDEAGFIDGISVAHQEHHFRYPQKAGRIELAGVERALALTDGLLKRAFHLIGGPQCLS
jgi:hypothetical protein